jgi:hypothetical protein
MLSDWAGQLPGVLLRASSTALLSLAVSDVSTAEGAAAAVDSVTDQHAAVLHTAGGILNSAYALTPSWILVTGMCCKLGPLPCWVSQRLMA